MSDSCEWAAHRGLDTIVGPKGFSILDGYGVLTEGFEHHQMMTMTNYNYAYYGRKHVLDWAQRIADAYNKAFVNNWEYTPLTQREKQFVIDNLLKVSDYRLVKIITHQNDVVGFLFAFPVASRAFRRAKGHLFPWNIVDLLLEMKRSDWVAVNGMGILPEFQGSGGNALMYAELEKTAKQIGFHFVHVEMTLVAETAVQMRRDLVNLGGMPCKNHRVYRKKI